MQRFDFEILPQPDDTACGPTCVHAVYQYYRDGLALEDVIAGVPSLANGGTLAVLLACHALLRGQCLATGKVFSAAPRASRPPRRP